MQIQNMGFDRNFFWTALLSKAPLGLEGGAADGQTEEVAVTVVLTVCQGPPMRFSPLLP